MSSKYPLKELFEIKEKRLSESEKELRRAKELLEAEEKKLQSYLEERDKAIDLRHAKLAQRDLELAQGTSGDKLHMIDQFIKRVVQEKINAEQKKVDQQTKVVIGARKKVEDARADRLRKQIELEKLTSHRTLWQKESLRHEEHKIAEEGDEIGTAMHHLRHIRKKDSL